MFHSYEISFIAGVIVGAGTVLVYALLILA